MLNSAVNKLNNRYVIALMVLLFVIGFAKRFLGR